ncbi:hypothetical protein OC834_006342 [Tilletia horrida]|nr:hypothetical protein OC834_006342 [Tilletia horrida]
MEAKQGDSSSSRPEQSAAGPSDKDKGKGKASAEVGLVMTAASIKRRERYNSLKGRERYKALIQQAKAADKIANIAHLKTIGETVVQHQRNIRQVVLDHATRIDMSLLANVRQLICKVTTLRHQMDEVFVEPDIITAAVDHLVQPNNYEALLKLLHRPLSFRPADWPTAFEKNGKGFLYLREDKETVAGTLSAFSAAWPAQKWWLYALQDQLQYEGGSASAYIKYAGETSAHDDVAARLHQDERAEMPTRFGAWTSVRQSLKSARDVVSSDEDATFTIWSLKMVHTAAERTGATAFRESEVAQEMERALIAVLGFSSLNSAVGGRHFPWDYKSQEETGTSFRDYVQAHSASASARKADPTIKAKVVSTMRNFLTLLAQQPRENTGPIITGAAEQSAFRYATSAPTQPSSAVIMKDVTRESFHAQTDQLSFFGIAAGPGPQLEKHISNAVESIWTKTDISTVPAPFTLRFYWDFWWAVLVHVLVFIHVQALAAQLAAAKVEVIRVESSKVSSLFINGYFLDPKSARDAKWDELPLSAWVDRVCTIYLHIPTEKDVPKSIVILSVDPGAVKYDPLLARYRARLLFFSMLIQRAAEDLLSANMDAIEVRKIIHQHRGLWAAIESTKTQFKADQHAVWSLRHTQTSVTPSEEQTQATSVRMSTVRQEEFASHLKAPGKAWSDERLAAWDAYSAGSHPVHLYVITANATKLPCPATIEPFSGTHRDWFCSRHEGVSLSLAARQHDAHRSDPDLGPSYQDDESYFEARRAAQAQRKVDKKLHRCTENQAATPIAQSETILRRILFLPSEVVDSATVAENVWEEVQNKYHTVPVADVLEASSIWTAFVDLASNSLSGSLHKLDYILQTSPEPVLILHQERAVPHDAEYDAILWAITQIFNDTHDESAVQFSHRTNNRIREALLPVLQRDIVDGAMEVACKQKPPCDYHEVIAAFGPQGQPRNPPQHSHRSPKQQDEAGTSSKKPTSRPVSKIVAHLDGFFNLPPSLARELILDEAANLPAADSQSVILWGISKERLQNIGSRPLSATATQTIPIERQTRSRLVLDDNVLALSFSNYESDERAFVNLEERRRLENIFKIDRPHLAQYLRNHKRKLLQIRRQLEASTSAGD